MCEKHGGTHGKANTAGTLNRPSYIQVTSPCAFLDFGGHVPAKQWGLLRKKCNHQKRFGIDNPDQLVVLIEDFSEKF
ncbi:hypothetical protein BpHYR1_035116 [Brachionus plicatilis]|uniref:Uncharacterized protein n=1 Tax=Brachionus plicatilis TaxID=10195 RepID=A0A3M7RJB4_BRAPC|nr:hypothetical protein BpHYR1_035116 [Brachionus plicatilis]